MICENIFTRGKASTEKKQGQRRPVSEDKSIIIYFTWQHKIEDPFFYFFRFFFQFGILNFFFSLEDKKLL